jgi:hypothetical protein
MSSALTQANGHDGAVRISSPSVQLTVVTFPCICGEHIKQTLTGWPRLDIECSCGEIWEIQVDVTLNQKQREHAVSIIA